MYDVVVIGAGPSGCYTSFLLAKENLNVLLLDKGRTIKDSKICTGIIGEEAFRTFPIPKDAILKDIDSAKFISPSGEVFRYQHNSTFAHVLDRSEFDCSILKMALNKGVTFSSSSFVEDLRTEKEGVEVFYKYQGIPTSVKARTVVVASGIGPSIMKKINIGEPNKFLQGVQVEVDFDDLDEVEVYLGENIAPGSFAWAVPLKDGKAKLGLMHSHSAHTYLESFLNSPSIKKRLKSNDYKIKCRPIGNGIARRTYCSRVLAVGDAAGQVKTTTGGGIYYGLIGAELAFQTIIDAFKKGDYSETHFRMYEKRWRERLEPEINTGLKLREIYSNLRDDKIDFLIDLANKNGIVPLIRNKAKFDWLRFFFLAFMKKPTIQKILFSL